MVEELQVFRSVCMMNSETVTGMCVCELVYSTLRKGGGRLSVKLVCVVVVGVYITYCMCSSENNGMEASKIST